MVRLNKQQKKEIVSVMRNSGHKRKEISELRTYLNRYYNLNFDFASVKHWANKAFRQDYIQELEQDNQIVKKWQNESDTKPEKESVRYAEWLFSLARG